MGLKNVTALAVALTIAAASTGQLPKIILAVHIAQLKLLKASQASKWPKAMLLPNLKR